MWSRRDLGAGIFLWAALSLPSVPSAAIDANQPEGALLGFPELGEPGTGARIADGKYKQWIEGGKLFVQIDYHFKDGRSVEERLTFEREPIFKQDAWSWKETKSGKELRAFSVDFRTHQALALKIKEKRETGAEEYDHWEEKLDDIIPGRTFAGTGVSFAVKRLMVRLLKGEQIVLKSVAFSPKPRVVDIEVRRLRDEKIRVSSQSVVAAHLIIHPKVPAIAKVFVSVKDLHLWVSQDPPYQALRFEGPLQEPSDPIVRLNIYPEARESG